MSRRQFWSSVNVLKLSSFVVLSPYSDLVISHIAVVVLGIMLAIDAALRPLMMMMMMMTNILVSDISVVDRRQVVNNRILSKHLGYLICSTGGGHHIQTYQMTDQMENKIEKNVNKIK